MDAKKAFLLIASVVILLALFFQLRGRSETEVVREEEPASIPEGRPIVLPNMPDPYGDEGFCEPTPWGADEPSYYPVPIGTSFYGHLRSAKVLKHCDIMLVFYTGGRFMSRGQQGEPEGMPFSAVNLYFDERALVYKLALDRWYYVEVNATGYPVVLKAVPESEAKVVEEIK